MRKMIKSARFLPRLEALEDRTLLTGPYAPAAGQPGSTAISKDAPAFVGWATGWEDYVVGTNVSASFQTPEKALGKAAGTSTDIVALGNGGAITLTFDRPIANGPGPDFAAFENGFSDTFLELGFVEVSSDGNHFVPFSNDSLTPGPVGGFGAIDPTNITGYVSKYRVGFGTPFDLEELEGVDPMLDVNAVTHVRIVDITGDGTVLDSTGNPIYDPHPTTGSAGVDLEAIGVLNYRPKTVHFEDVGADLADESYFNGPDPNGTQGPGPFGDQVVFGEFQSGGLRFNNEYSLDFGSSTGWAYSNTTDTTTANFTNQFSASPGSGAADSRTYAVAFRDLSDSYPPPTIERTAATEGLVFRSLWVTNTTYAYLAMRDGDQFAKKFGGASGDDPDFFLLTITGKDSGGAAIGSVEFYLADYRFANNALDYIVNEWTEIDVSSLGSAASLEFVVTGSDVGSFGLNTPAYFALDNVALDDVTPPTVVSIDDGDANDTVVENTTLTYTVTFSEPLAGGSFTAADLDNAGTASITIGAIVEVSAGTYTVAVTPTAAGTLILRIPGGVVVEDIAGNDLATPVQDNTMVTVTVNNPPTVANAIPDQTFTGSGPKTFQFADDTFADADGAETLSFSAVLVGGGVLPAWLTFTPATRTFSGNPSVGDTTPLQIRVTANDGNGGTVSDDFQLTLTTVNDPPTVASTISDQTFTGSGPKTFQFAANTFTDADTADTLSVSPTLVGGGVLPAWLTFTLATRTFSGNPSAGDTTPLQIRVTANDGNGGTVSEDFQLTLINVNDTPTVANAIADQTFTGSGPKTFQVADDTFVDADGADTLSFSALLVGGAALPAWLTFTPATRTFSGNPSAGDTTPLQIRVTANDGNGGTVTEDFQLALTDVNDTPTLANAIPDQTFTGSGPKTFQLADDTFADADGADTLPVSATLVGGAALPEWLTFTPATRTFSGNPSVGDTTPLQIRVTANDGNGGTVTEDFQLTLTTVNDSPTVASTISDQTFTGSGPKTFQFAANTFTDADTADTLSFSAMLVGGGVLPAWLTFTPATRTFSGNPGVSDTTPLQIRVTANDGNGGSISDDFQLTLTNVNDPPTVANAIPDQTFTGSGPKTFQFAGNVFADADANDTLTVTATLVGGSPLPAWLSFTPATRTFSGNPGVSDTTPLQIRVTANDGNGGTVTEDFQLTLTNVNDTPTVANAIPDQTFTGSGPKTFQLADDTFADADGADTLPVSATLVGGAALPEWLTFTPATRTFSGNPSVSDTTPLQIRVTANDGNGGTVTEDFQLTLINVNDIPTVASAIPDQTFTGPGIHSFQVAANTFADADTADTLSVSPTLVGGAPLPAWLTFTPATRTFSGNPSAGDTTPLQIRVTANDGNGGTVTEDFQLALTDVNDTPTLANAIPDQTFTGSGPKTFQLADDTFADADGADTLPVSATLVGGAALPEWLTFTPATRTFSGNPSVGDTTPLQIRVTANDGNGGTVTEDFQLTLTTVNDSPTVASTISDQTFTGSGPKTFQFAANTFTDADTADTLSFSAMLVGGGVLPAWLTFTPATRTFSGNPGVSDTTPLQIRVTANDGNGGSISDDFQLTLTNVNDPPTVANAIPDQTFTGSGPKTFQFAGNVFADADANDTLTVTATLVGGSPLPAWLSFTPATRTFSGNPGVSDTTPLQIRVTANDGNGGTVTEDFQLTLTNVNDTPTVANAIPDQTFTGSGPKTFQLADDTFADADGADTLPVSATLVGGAALPEWLTFTPATRTFSGNPSVSDTTPLQIRVTANDGNGGTVTEDFQLTLINVNDIPTVASAIPDQTFTGPGIHSFQVAANTFADADTADTLSVSPTLVGGAPLPAWLTFTPATRTFSGNPSAGDTTPLQIRVTANDGNGGTVSDGFQLTLTTVNDPPTVANAIADQTFTGSGPKTFQVADDTFVDADGADTLSFSALLVGGAALPAWLTFTPATRTFSGNPSAGDTTPLQIRVTANDGNGGTVTEDFQLALTDVNDTPTLANAIPDQTFTGSGPKTFQLADDTFADADGADTLPVSATLVGGAALPEWLTFTPATRTFSGNPSVSDTTPLQIRVTANDGNGGTVTEDFQLTLTNVNDTPTLANAIPDQTFTGPGIHSFQVAANTFADTDTADTLSFSATLVGGAPLPAWLTFAPATRTFSGNPGVTDATPLQIRVTADDGNGGSISDDFQLTLTNVNDPPTVANAIPDQTFTGSGPKTFQFAGNVFADADANDTLSFSAMLVGGAALPAWLNFTPATRTFSGNPSAGDTTPLQIRVTANDGNGGTVGDDFQLTLTTVNDPPTVANAIADQTFTGSGPKTFQVAANTFADADTADTLSFSATLAGGSPLPAWLTFTPATRTFGGNPNVGDTTPLQIRVTANDGNGGTVSDDFQLTLTTVNDPPAVTTNVGLTLNEGAAAGIGAFQLAATDADSTPEQLTYTVTTGPASGTVRRNGTPATSFTQADLNAGLVSYQHNGGETTADSFTFTVTDGTSTTGGTTFSITVNPVNDPPTVITNGGLTVTTGGVEVIGAARLNAGDPEGTAAQLTYSISAGPANGTVRRDGTPVTSFTQADLNAGLVSYQHNGSATTADAFIFTVSDGTTTSESTAFAIVVTPPAPPASTGGGTSASAPPPLAPVLVALRRRRAPALLVIVYVAADGTPITFRSPFQRPRFRNVRVEAIDVSGDGVADVMIVTAFRGRALVSRYYPRV